MIKSVFYNQKKLIYAIQSLHLNNANFELDPTYSKGNFYEHENQPKFRYDIRPQKEYVVKNCSTNLPHKNNSIKSVIYDPPFLATTGPSLIKKQGNLITKRFGYYQSENELYNYWYNSIDEFTRILEHKGILVIKIQDKVSSGKQYFAHCDVYNYCISKNFYALDLFILIAKSRMIPEWHRKNQKHARKFHSYFWVFRKQ